MKHEATTEAEKRLVMFPRLNRARVEMNEIISEVLTKAPIKHDFTEEVLING